jgi:hypothetical protein
MPNMFVAAQATTLEDLAASLLRSRLSAPNRASALRAIQEANPGLDFTRIDAGTVVVVPPVAGVKNSAVKDPIGGAADGLIQLLTDGLDAFFAAVDAGESQRRVDAEQTLATLDSEAVSVVARDNQQLSANLESVRAALKDDNTVARQQHAALKQAREDWSGQLAQLRALL